MVVSSHRFVVENDWGGTTRFVKDEAAERAIHSDEASGNPGSSPFENCLKGLNNGDAVPIRGEVIVGQSSHRMKSLGSVF